MDDPISLTVEYQPAETYTFSQERCMVGIIASPEPAPKRRRLGSGKWENKYTRVEKRNQSAERQLESPKREDAVNSVRGSHEEPREVHSAKVLQVEDSHTETPNLIFTPAETELTDSQVSTHGCNRLVTENGTEEPIDVTPECDRICYGMVGYLPITRSLR